MNNELTIEDYGRLCMAQARGEEMEFTGNDGTVNDVLIVFGYEAAKRYNWRTKPKPKPKPKPKTLKLYLWALKFNDGLWIEGSHYFATEEKARELYSQPESLKRLDWSMIEVEQ